MTTSFLFPHDLHIVIIFVYLISLYVAFTVSTG